MKVSLVVIFLAASVAGALSACSKSEPTTVSSQSLPSSSPVASAESTDRAVANLQQWLQTLKDSTTVGDVAVAIAHVETGQTVEIDGARKLPLYSVFKVPLAIAVLKGVEEKRLELSKQIRVGPGDVAPGSQFNTDLWRKPVDKTVTELIELSIVRSDNTSSDKLLELVGGPAGVTKRMRELGFANIDIISTTREITANRDRVNIGAAADLADFLVKLKKGALLQPDNTQMVLGFMTRALIGERRLRGKLPPGTAVADKTGTGETTTNDVGIITLPEGRGHLAIAVFINGSKSTTMAQEDVIAAVGRAAYDSFVSVPAVKP